jgi:uncharacterized protein DUF6812
VDEVPRPLYVPTQRIEALVRAGDQLIVGRLHAEPGKRLKDEMNQTSMRFIAITDARVYDAASRELLYSTDFLLVASGHILTVTPRQSVTVGQPPWREAPPK